MDSLNMSDQDIFAMFNNDEDNILSGASTHSTEFGAVPTSPPNNADFLLNSVDFPNFDELLASAPLAAPAPATLDHLKDAPVAPMPFFVPSAAEVDAVSGHHNHHNNNDIVIPMMAAFDQVPVMSQVASAPVPATIDYSAQQPQQRRRVVVDRAAQPYNNIAAVPAFGNHAGQASATSLSPPPSNPQTGASPGAFDHADILPAIQHVTMSDASSPPAYVDDSSSTATTPPAAAFNSEDETGADDKAASATKKKMPKSKSKRKRKASLGVTQDELEELRAKGLDPEIIAKIENDEVDAATSRAFKRQRRLIRNRESAQLSRQRKKHYVKNLEERVTQFSTENQVLKTKLADLEATNASLEDELKHLRSMMGTQATASSVWSRLQSGGKDGASTNAKSAGMALFVVVLSLGLLFNGSDSSPLPFKTHTPVEVPEVVPSATSDRAYYGRVLNSIEETANVPTHVFTREVRATPPARTTAEVYPHAERAAAAKAAHARQVAETQEQLRSLVEAAKAEAARNSSSAVTTDATTALTDMDTTATTATTTTMATSDASSPDAYVMCPRAHTFIPDSSASSDDEEPIISLMLPSSAFDAQGNFSSRGAAAGPHADDDMLQLTCRVSDVTVVPGGNLTATAGNGGGMGAGSEYGAGSSMVASSLGAALVRSEA